MTGRHARRCCREGGFTLFELVIVIAIVGAVAALVAPRITKLPQQTTPEVVSFLESERSKAVDTGKATEIRLAGRTLSSTASGATLNLGSDTRIQPIHPAPGDYMPSFKLTEFYADGTMRTSSFQVSSSTSKYTVHISPFASRIRYAHLK